MNIKLPLVVLSSVLVLSSFSSAFAQSNTSIFNNEERAAIAFLLGYEDAEENIPQNVVLRKNILFTFDKSKVKSEYDFNINEVANVITKTNGVKTVIRAYTDTTGKATYNQKLSQKRANAVKKALIRYNVPSDMIRAIGYGESSRYSNATRYGRAKNRRAEIEIAKIQDQAVIKLIEIKPYEYREVEEPVKTEETINTNNYSNIRNLLNTYSSYCSNLENKINTYKSCTTKKDKPLAACEESEKRNYGVTACAAVMGGCEIMSINTDAFWGDQAIAQGCGVLSANLQGIEYTATDVLKNSMIAIGDGYSDELIKKGNIKMENSNFFEGDYWDGVSYKILGSIGRGLTTSIKKSDFESCVNNVERECSSIRREWEQNSNNSCENNRELEELNSTYISRCL